MSKYTMRQVIEGFIRSTDFSSDIPDWLEIQEANGGHVSVIGNELVLDALVDENRIAYVVSKDNINDIINNCAIRVKAKRESYSSSSFSQGFIVKETQPSATSPVWYPDVFTSINYNTWDILGVLEDDPNPLDLSGHWLGELDGYDLKCLGVSTIGNDIYAKTKSSKLCQYTGTSWEELFDFGWVIGGQDIYAYDENNIWVAGEEGSLPKRIAIYYWDGNSLSEVFNIPITDDHQEVTIDGCDPNNIWVTAKSDTVVGEVGIWYYDGVNWAQQSLNDCKDLSVRDANNVWACGDTGIWYYNGVAWALELDGSGNPITDCKKISCCIGDNEVWGLSELYVVSGDWRYNLYRYRNDGTPWYQIHYISEHIFSGGAIDLYVRDIACYDKDNVLVCGQGLEYWTAISEGTMGFVGEYSVTNPPTRPGNLNARQKGFENEIHMDLNRIECMGTFNDFVVAGGINDMSYHGYKPHVVYRGDGKGNHWDPLTDNLYYVTTSVFESHFPNITLKSVRINSEDMSENLRDFPFSSERDFGVSNNVWFSIGDITDVNGMSKGSKIIVDYVQFMRTEKVLVRNLTSALVFCNMIGIDDDVIYPGDTLEFSLEDKEAPFSTHFHIYVIQLPIPPYIILAEFDYPSSGDMDFWGGDEFNITEAMLGMLKEGVSVGMLG